MIVGEAEKLFYKLVKASMNKVITDCTFSKSPLPSSLPVTGLSDVQKDCTQKLAAYAYREEEEHTFIQSKEIDNEDQDN
jgi:hypothetical protein